VLVGVALAFVLPAPANLAASHHFVRPGAAAQ
jgi:hypothetical protein